MRPLRISGTTSRLDCSRQLRRYVAQLGHTVGVLKPGGGMNMWKRPLLPSGQLSRPGRLVKALGHRTMQPNEMPDMQCTMLVKKPTRRSTRILTPRPEIYRLANQFRRENTDVVGDKPVKNDAGEMSMSEDSKQKAWLEHYQRLLYVEFDWDPDHLSYQPPMEGPPISITIDMVKKAISQMMAGKAPGPSGIVLEMIRAAGDMGASMIRDLAVAIIRDGKVPSDWEQSFIGCLYKGKGDALERGNYCGLKANRAGYENPGEDCGRPHQTVGVNRQFPVSLRPRQRHYRRNLCCQAAAREVSSCQQETLHGFRRPGEGV